MDFRKLKTYFIQFRDTMLTHSEAVVFIRKNKLWEGFWRYGWVSKVLVVLAVLLGMKLLKTITGWLSTADTGEDSHSLAYIGSLFQNLAFESYDFLFTGGMKYILIILLEVIIFHMSRGALEILTGKSSDMDFNNFLKAQIRMIKVAIRAYIFEMVISILIKIAFGIFDPPEFFEEALKYTVHCYFLGFIILDNYHEQFGLSIKESEKYARNYVGVCLALGLTTNLLLFIPLIGAIIAPVIVAVTATLVMYHLSDLHLENRREPDPVVVSD